MFDSLVKDPNGDRTHARHEWRELKRLFVVSGRHWFGCLFPEKGDGAL